LGCGGGSFVGRLGRGPHEAGEVEEHLCCMYGKYVNRGLTERGMRVETVSIKLI
jgi:hypothetical protein